MIINDQIEDLNVKYFMRSNNANKFCAQKRLNTFFYARNV